MTNTDNFFSSLPFIIAVIQVPDSGIAADTARALYDGGVRAIELTLRNNVALESIKKIREQVPNMIVGAGTVIDPAQIQQVIDAGAVFAVAPGMNEKVVEEAKTKQIPFAPGIAVPSDIEKALGLGITTMKVFPAKYLGGIPYMKSIYTPYAHLGLRFIPLGGLVLEDIASCLKEEMILSIGGSWIAQKGDMENRRWSAITQNARKAVEAVKNAGGRI